jgi:hypothetical protein
LVRHPLDDDRFSGWFVLSGRENIGVLNDRENFAIVGQGELFDRWPVLDSGLEGPVGTVMVWNETDMEYQLALP